MQPVSNMLPILLRHARQAPVLSVPVWRALWSANVGEALASHTEVLRFHSGTLTVKVDHHAWHQQLLELKSDLIDALNETCGRKLLAEIQFIYSNTPLQTSGPLHSVSTQ